MQVRLFSPASGSLLGVDIGATAVKLVELSHRAGSRRLEAWAIAPLPSGVVSAGSIGDAGAVADAIRQAVKQAGSRSKRAAAAVAGSATATRTLSFDAALTDAELEVEVALEAEDSLPFEDADLAVDFQVMHLSAQDPAKVDVLVTACRREHVAMREAALKGGGLKAVVVDVETHCLHRAARASWPSAVAEQPVAVVDIGAERTSLTVFQDEAAIFTREEALAATGLAESQLLAAMETAPGHGTPSPVEGVLQQISRLLRLGEAALGNRPVPSLLIAGGGARLEGLADMAAERLQRAVEVANPFADMEVSGRIDAAALAEHAPALATACGLALFDDPAHGEAERLP